MASPDRAAAGITIVEVDDSDEAYHFARSAGAFLVDVLAAVPARG